MWTIICARRHQQAAWGFCAKRHKAIRTINIILTRAPHRIILFDLETILNSTKQQNVIIALSHLCSVRRLTTEPKVLGLNNRQVVKQAGGLLH